MKAIIHLVCTQNFSKNLYFLPPDTHRNVCLSGGKKCKFFGKFCVRNKPMIHGHFTVTGPFIYPLKTSENLWLLTIAESPCLFSQKKLHPRCLIEFFLNIPTNCF